LSGDLGANDGVVEIMLRGIRGRLRRLELRSRVVDILLRDCPPRDERFEPGDGALRILQPSGGTAIGGFVSRR